MATQAEIKKLFDQIRELRAERQVLRALAEEERLQKIAIAREKHAQAELKRAQENAVVQWLLAQERLQTLPRFVTTQYLCDMYATFNKFETPVTANKIGRLITMHLTWERRQARQAHTNIVQRVYDTRPQAVPLTPTGIDMQFRKDFPT